MAQYRLEYRDAVGVELSPGSLNVVLDGPWTLERPHVRLLAAAVGVDLSLARCRIADVGCWIVRTDRNNLGAGDHPLDVIEIVSSVHLRTTLNLIDGDQVSVLVEP